MKKILKIIKLVSIVSVIACAIIVPTIEVLAQPNQDPYIPLAPIPGTTETCSGPNCGTKLPTYLTGMFKVGIVLAGVLAFLMIVLGGFQYLSTDALTGKEEGRERIERAIGGLILALTSYIILYTINPALVNLDLNFGKQLNAKDGALAPTDFESLDNLYATLHKEVADTVKTAEEKKATADQIRAQMSEVTNQEAYVAMRDAADKLEYQAIALQNATAIKQNKQLALDTRVDSLGVNAVQDSQGYQRVMVGSYNNAIDAANRFSDQESAKRLELEKFTSLDETATKIASSALEKRQGYTAVDIMLAIYKEKVAAVSKAKNLYLDDQLAQQIENQATATINKIKQACANLGNRSDVQSCRNFH